MPLRDVDNNKVLLCTGAPDNMSDDYKLGQIVAAWHGRTIIMGGTTAKIIARELGREITVNLRLDPSGLPPTSTVEGIDIISEGTLTLTAVRDLLKANFKPANQLGVKYDILRLLDSVNEVYIFEGSKINPTHFVPNLPVKLEKRSVLIRQIAEFLEKNYKKRVILHTI